MSDISSLLNITSDSIKNIVNSGTSVIGKSGDSSALMEFTMRLLI